ncbi:uncharacterized protein LOC117110621 isoform X1 [Anneissia japonica]|uniref:uncharacterized protein LOC117110621 isoform X1 n=1 Tax=Anneissia japonica TaxID=1529436 RepID=UPI001425A225|nr:uncharacterized protein LOC117110621 isoform X1 [Anneissia japonica]
MSRGTTYGTATQSQSAVDMEDREAGKQLLPPRSPGSEDSDDVQEFSLPPPRKSNRQNRKKLSSRVDHGQYTSFNVTLALKFMLVVFILTCVCGLCIISLSIKEELEQMKRKLDMVENVSGSSKSQLDSTQALINGLEKNINDTRNRLKENVQRMDLKLLDINTKVAELNASSLLLKSKIQSLMPQQQTAADGPQLQKVVAGLGSEVEELKGTVQDVQSSQKHQQQEFQSLSKNVADLTVNETLVNLSTVWTTVSNMDLSRKPNTSAQAPPQEVPTTLAPPASENMIPAATTSTQQAIGNTVVTLYLEQEIKKLSDTIGVMNASLFKVEQQQTNFSKRLQNVELLSDNMPSGLQVADNSSVSLVDLMKLQSDVNSLMAHTENISIGTSDIDPRDILTIRAQIADLQLTVNTLTDKIHQLTTPSLNNNLLNMNTTLGIQTVMASSLQKFKDENIENLNNVKFTLGQLQLQTDEQAAAIRQLEEQLEDMHHVIVELSNTSKQNLASETNRPASIPIAAGSTPLKSTYVNTPETVATDVYSGELEEETKTESVTGEVVSAATPPLMLNSSETLQEVKLPPPLGYLTDPNISTIEDLQARFTIWDIENHGSVKFQDFANFMGSNFSGTAQLEQFDHDRDSRLSFQELAEAYGFPDPSDDVHNRRRIQEGSASSDAASGV